MGNEVYLTGQLLEVVRGQAVDERWLESWHDRAILDGRGSANIPLLAAAVGFYQTHRNNDRETWKRLIDWLGLYFELPFMAHEPGSRTYCSWILMPLLTIGHLLRRVGGHPELVDLHARKLRAFWAFAAAGAAPRPAKMQRVDPQTNRWSGPYTNWVGVGTTFCGARANTCWQNPQTRGRFDPQTGEPNFIQYIQSLGLDYVLAVAIGKLGITGGPERLWERQLIEAMAQKAPQIPFSGLTDEEAALLHRIVRNLTQPPRRRDAEQLAAWIGEWLPKVPFRILRTRRGVATVGLKSTNTGSTNYLYAVTWNAETGQLDFLGLDDPRFRSQGRAGAVEIDLEARTVGGLRSDGQAFSWPEGLRLHAKSLALPGGPIFLDLEIKRDGVSFKIPEASEVGEAGGD